MEDLVIYGAGGYGREVEFLVRDINAGAGKSQYNLIGFIDDDLDRTGSIVGGLPILGDGSWFDSHKQRVACTIPIGSPKHIARISTRLRALPHVFFPNLIHPQTIWWQDRIEIGEGNIITAGNVLTVDIRIGSFNLLNRGCQFGHDDVIGDACVINPGCNISGAVTLAGENLVGTGATILQNLEIGHGATVGSGAVVTRNVRPGVVVVGVPARPMSR